MKKFVLFLLLATFGMLRAQAPAVVITVDSIAPTAITCSFQKNDSCAAYHILLAEPGTVEQYIGSFFGNTLHEVIVNWSIPSTADTTYTWDELTPATTYVVYALATGAGDSILYSDTVRSASQGGHGTSIITLSVSDITDTAATTVATPNAETMLFKDFVVEAGVLDSLPMDTVIAWLHNEYSTFYTTDTWHWLSLTPGTDYIFIAQGMNADSVWGEVAQFSFRTTGGATAICPANASHRTIRCYPNPAADRLTVDGLQSQSRLLLFDLQGRLLMQQTATAASHTIPVQSLQPGTYLLRVITPGSRPQTATFCKTAGL